MRVLLTRFDPVSFSLREELIASVPLEILVCVVGDFTDEFLDVIQGPTAVKRTFLRGSFALGVNREATHIRIHAPVHARIYASIFFDFVAVLLDHRFAAIKFLVLRIRYPPGSRPLFRKGTNTGRAIFVCWFAAGL